MTGVEWYAEQEASIGTLAMVLGIPASEAHEALWQALVAGLVEMIAQLQEHGPLSSRPL